MKEIRILHAVIPSKRKVINQGNIRKFHIGETIKSKGGRKHRIIFV